MVGMSLLRALGRSASTTVRAARGVTVGGIRAGRFVSRNMATARSKGGGGEAGMLRLLDLHAASCAGDTLVALGLAGTIFFSVPAGEARSRVALYLLVTMLPFVLLAPVVGPVLDHFRHGRRYALAVTMLGRAFLAYLISEHLTGFLLFPAAFGQLVLSRAYGVARSAAVPRLLPPGLGLSEAGARASLYGTFAGLLVLPIGLLANAIGPEWALRLSMVAFIYGMITALRLPARADSDPPEEVPRPLQRPGHKTARALSGRLVVSTLLGSCTLRALYGFLTLYVAFAVKEHRLPVKVARWELNEQLAIVVVASALGIGTFLATAVGTRLRIRRPTLLQGLGIGITAVSTIFAAASGSLAGVALLCLVASVASGLGKLANDAVIQERIGEQVKASAFAHSETLLMVAWVVGAGIGLIPFSGRWGLIVAAAFMALGGARAIYAAFELRKERLTGRVSNADDTTVVAGRSDATVAAGSAEATVVAGSADATTQPRGARSDDSRTRPGGGRGDDSRSWPGGGRGDDSRSWPSAPGHAGTRPAGSSGATGRTGAGGPTTSGPRGGTTPTARAPGAQRTGSGTGDATTARMPAGDARRDADRTVADSGRTRRFSWRRRRTVETPHGDHPTAEAGSGRARGGGAGGGVGPGGGAGHGSGSGGAQRWPDGTRPMPVDVSAPISPAPDDGPMAPPGYTLYRPSGLDPTRRLDADDDPDGDDRR
jgi:hypothetical protein